nr:hypothetical protein [Tanacetum cinerariifolium]
EGLGAGIKHGKSGRTLAQVEAYDPGVKGDLVSAVTDFENVSFGLLDELESLKDSLLASIMSALVLKDAQGAADHPVYTLVLPSDEGPVTQPPVTYAHDDLFDTFVLYGTGDA